MSLNTMISGTVEKLNASLTSQCEPRKWFTDEEPEQVCPEEALPIEKFEGVLPASEYGYHTFTLTRAAVR